MKNNENKKKHKKNFKKTSYVYQVFSHFSLSLFFFKLIAAMYADRNAKKKSNNNKMKMNKRKKERKSQKRYCSFIVHIYGHTDLSIPMWTIYKCTTKWKFRKSRQWKKNLVTVLKITQITSVSMVIINVKCGRFEWITGFVLSFMERNFFLCKKKLCQACLLGRWIGSKKKIPS